MRALLAEPDARYVCTSCGEEQLVWAGSPPDDETCPDCARAARAPSIEERLAAAGVPADLCVAQRELRAERWSVPRPAAEWRGRPGCLLLTGPTGTGKSTLAVALLAELSAGGARPAYVSAALLMLELGEEYSGLRRGVLRGYIDAGVLVLDDLGTEPIRSDTAPALGLLVDQRWSSGRPTIYVSNLPLVATRDAPSLADYDPRLVSRMASGLVVRMDGDDHRLGRRPGRRS